MSIKLLCAILIVNSALLGQVIGQVIEGSVTSLLDGVPIPGASISIEQGGKTAYRATTDAAGAFHIDGVKDGVYTATFNKNGFVAPARDAEARRPFRVAAGGATVGTTVRLHAQLTPMGKVSGRVFDDHGGALADVAIELIFANSMAGETGATQKDGSFLFSNVEPGTYHLSARPRGKIASPAPIGDQRRGWLRTYYPGVLDKGGAAKIIVRPGAEVPGQDIRLIAVPVHTVRGRVLDPQGDPAAAVTVKLATADEFMQEEMQSPSMQDGSFEFPDLRDGHWRLFAETETGGVKYHAFAPVEVMGHDLEHRDLRLSPPFTIQGRVELDPAGSFQGKRLPVLVMLFPAGGGPSYGQGNPDEQGNFKIDGVFEGPYLVRAITGAELTGYYLASQMLGERDVLAQKVELVSGSLPLRLVYKSNGGTVRGTVAECGSAAVLLVPQNPDLRQVEFLRRASCSAGGRYEIANVRPGDYYAFAFGEAPGLIDVLSRFSQSLVNQAVNVGVRQGEAVGADLKVIALN